ncbi:MAG: hypothetical protein ACYTGP_08885 [Planctomycetota bacterium]|jgi:hypothetical protein
MKRPRWLAILLTVTVLGCETPPQPTHPEESLAEAFANEEGVTTELELQALVMAMADDYGSRMWEITYDLLSQERVTPNERALGRVWLRSSIAAAIDIGAGANPDVALLDMLVLVSLQTAAFERHWIPNVWGEDRGRPVLARLETLEGTMWTSASEVLDDRQRATLRRLIDEWLDRPENEGRYIVEAVRFREFADDRRVQNLALTQEANGLLREVAEAVRSVDDIRLLGERAMWYSTRALALAGHQSELVVMRLLGTPEIAELREQVRHFDTHVGRFVDSMEQLPRDIESAREAALEDLHGRIAAEREAAIDGVFDRVAQEREAFLGDLEAREDELTGLMHELRLTIDSATTLARALEGTAVEIDTVVARFDEGERDPDGDPLDFKELRDTAIETATAAEQITILLRETNTLLDSPQLAGHLALIDEEADSIVDRLFWRAVLVVLLLLAGLAVIRRIPARTARP